MVEETLGNVINKPKAKTNRPKAVYSWSTADVQKWLHRHCSEYQSYAVNFAVHEVTGRTLLRITDNSLLRLGITNAEHRDAIWREILKLQLKNDIMEIRDNQKRNTNNMFYDYSIA